MTENHASTTPVASERTSSGTSRSVLGPFTARDVIVLLGALLIFVASLIPVAFGIGVDLTLWSFAGLYFLGTGVILPLVVGALFLSRRLNPASAPRIGSLSVDQFGSVVASYTAAYFLLTTVMSFEIAYVVGLAGALLMLAGTVLAAWIPAFAADFADRLEVPAHPAARPARAAVRVHTPKPVAAVTAAPTAAQVAADVIGRPLTEKPSGQNATSTPERNFGWNANPAAATHTPGGQIYTPAGSGRPTSNFTGSSGGSFPGSTAKTTAEDTATDDAATVESIPETNAAKAATVESVPETNAAPAQESVVAEVATPADISAAPLTSEAPVVEQVADEQAAEELVAEEQVAAAPTPDEQVAETAAATAAETETAAATAAETATAAVADPAAPRGTELDNATATPASDSAAAPATVTEADTEATNVNPKIHDEVLATGSVETIRATVDPAAARKTITADPFWFAVDRPQNVVDERTRQFAFKLIPGVWILALEDRGSSFLVQDSHGKTGVLLDLTGIERAPEN